MRSSITIFTAVLLTSLLWGCGGTSPNTNTANVANTNTNPLETTKKTPEATSNDAPTLAPVFKAYCEALEKGDEAGLRKVYSAATLKSFEAEMKRDKIKGLVKLLEEDKTTSAQCSIRNEVITGDTAVANVKTLAYATDDFKVVFVKEADGWKMTNKSPNFDSVTNAAPSASK